jgi:hypothetical protein
MKTIAFDTDGAAPAPLMQLWATDGVQSLFCLKQGEACAAVFYEPLFCSTLAICQGDKMQCSMFVRDKLEEKLHNPEFLIQTDGFACNFRDAGRALSVIWLGIPKADSGVVAFSWMAHEAVHWAYATMERVGMTPLLDNEELVAYMVQFAMNCYGQSIGVPLLQEEQA